MTTVLNGVLGGLVIGCIAAVVTRFVADEPSATAAVLERAAGSGILASRRAEFGIQILYGGLVGSVLVALELSVLGILAVPPTTSLAIGVAVAWSALLFGVLSVIWEIASSGSSERSHLYELLVYHSIYGFGFGVWIRVTWIT